MKKIILLFLILTAITEGCKKYDEGPLLSLRSAKKRVYGSYTLTQYTVNGVDSLSLFNDSLCNKLNFYFDTDWDLDVCNIYGKRKDGKISSLGWTWELVNKNKILKVNNTVCSSGTGPFISQAHPEWEILRLTNSELKMKTTYNSKEYLVDLLGS